MEQFTPLMRQYHQLKAEHPDAILLFRVGDFYEMFGDDAILGSKLLKLTLTKKHVGREQTVPLAGVPHHAVNSYLARLIKQGCKVAICEQMEDPKFAKGIVKRQIIRVITPGTILDGSLLEEKINNYLIAINAVIPEGTKSAVKLGLAVVDLSTGEFLVTEINDSPDFLKLATELERIAPRECLIPESIAQHSQIAAVCKRQSGMTIYPYQDYQFAYDSAYPKLIQHFQTTSLKGFGCEEMHLAVGAAGAILEYLKDTQKTELTHLNSLRVYTTEDYLILDAATIQNLELFHTQREKSKSGSLLGAIDETITAMGGRKLRSWVSQPLLNLNKLVDRQQGVNYFYQNQNLRAKLRELFDDIYDLERLLGKIGCGVANARDVLALKKSLDIIPQIKSAINNPQSEIINGASQLPSLISQLELDDIPELRELIGRAIVDDPPLSVKEGGLIKDGYHAPLDELRQINRSGKDWIVRLETQERERTGIKSLKVRFNNVFGYYIEVTKPNLSLVPADYQRKQTTATGERFTTPELKDWESKIFGAEEKMMEMEYQLFTELRDKLIQHTKPIQQTADAIGLLDVITTFAEIAVRYDYSLPELTEEPITEIKDGRHPVIERFLSEQQFVPNDTYTDTNENRLLLITGPNMAGKSTYIRQVALIALMGQIGSFVPAKSAKLGLVDRIFTRVGAADNLLRGESTFMVEMNETANILHNATSRSLLVLDEIGRGTSTFDGLSIAWAVAEFIHDNLQSRTLFATHYHELTQLASVLPGIKNYNVAVREWNEKVIFLHKIVTGPCDKSYGIAVARLAGLPISVITRAKEVLIDLEKYSQTAKNELASTHPELGKVRFDAPEVQLSFFDFVTHPVMDELKDLDLSNLTPLQALQKLQELQEKLKTKK
jgi:DNA mismatch repair protein MutS